MLRTNSSRTRGAPLVAILLLSASLLLAACGGSGGTSQTNASAPASTLDPHSAQAGTTGTQGTGQTGQTGKSGAQGTGGTSAGGVTKGSGKAPPSAGKGAGELSSAALSRFTACMRKNGAKLPAPGSASRVNTKSPQYRAAIAKCVRELRASGDLVKLDLSKIHLSKIHLNKIKVKVKVPHNLVKVPGVPKVEEPGTTTPR